MIEKQIFTLVGEAGGKRNAFMSGALHELHLLGLPPRFFDRVYGVSSSAHTLSFYVAGQIEATPRIWLEDLSGADVFSFLNPLRGRRFGDVDRVVDYGCRKLDLPRIGDATTRFVVVLSRLDTGKPIYIECTPENILDVLKATISIPWWSRPTYFNGIRVVDGAISDPFPIQQAIADGATRILAICNRPEGFILGGIVQQTIAPWTMFPTHRESRNRLQNRHRVYNTLTKVISSPPPGVEIFALRPSRNLTSIFEKNSSKIKGMIEHGREQARQAWENGLAEFLLNKNPATSH